MQLVGKTRFDLVMRFTLLTLFAVCPGVNLADEQPKVDAFANANLLFQAGNWNEARLAFESVASARKAQTSGDVFEPVRGSIACSLKLGEWDTAFDKVRWFRSNAAPAKVNRAIQYNESDDAINARNLADHLPYVLALLDELSQALKDKPEWATPERQRQLAAFAGNSATDFLKGRFGNALDTKSIWGRDRLNWWWEREEKEATTASDADEWERRWHWHGHYGLSLDVAGRPQFVTTPSRFTLELSKAAQVLYCLELIGRLDATKDRIPTAKSLLMRSQLTRKLYGPESDSSWTSAQMFYHFAGQPTFYASYRGVGTKPLWELADDETRTVVNNQLALVKLPDSENPLRWLDRVEKEFPNSQWSAEAIYLRGVYFQSRQHYDRAKAEYRRLAQAFPNHPRVKDAAERIARIDHADVVLGRTGTYQTDSRPTLTFAHRMTSAVEFKIWRVKLDKYLADKFTKKDPLEWSFQHLGCEMSPEEIMNDPDGDDDDKFESGKMRARYLSNLVSQWKVDLPKSDRVEIAKTTPPALPNGMFLIEARTPGNKRASRNIMVVSDISLCTIDTAKDGPARPKFTKTVLVSDSKTGHPVVGQEVVLLSQKDNSMDKPTLIRIKSDSAGRVSNKFSANSDGVAVAVSKSGGLAIRVFSVDRDDDEIRPRFCNHIMLDRPAYRPGSRVYFRALIREVVDRTLKTPEVGRLVRIGIEQDYEKPLKTIELRTDKFGAVAGSFALEKDMPLGRYRLHVLGAEHQDSVNPLSDWFLVEEYRKPEFEVKIEPTTDRDGAVRLGDKVKVRVLARYYSGEPVAGGRLRYRIEHNQWRQARYSPQPFDWLYSPGYGRHGYSYPWSTKSKGASVDLSGDDDDDDGSGRSFDDRKQLLTQAEAKLDANGNAEIQIDTAAIGRRTEGDRVFVVDANVESKSRRSVRGSGQFVAAEQPARTVIELDRNWYRPGESAVVELLAGDANGMPLPLQGQLRLSRITYHDSGMAEVREEMVVTQAVNIDKSGRSTVRMPLAREGQYRFLFVANGEVATEPAGKKGNSHRRTDSDPGVVVWVCGSKFDGRGYRFADLELIPDRRAYKVGDIAHLLVNVSNPDNRVDLVEDAGEGGKQVRKAFDMVGYSTVVDIPIVDKHVPNFIVTAMTPSDGHREGCEIFVPPVGELLNLRVTTDKPVYKPGEEGTLTVACTDSAGKPAAGQVALTAFDKALTSIHPEPTGGILAILEARKSRDLSSDDYNGNVEGMQASGGFVCPEFEIYDGPRDLGFGMGGGAATGGNPGEAKIKVSRLSVRGKSADSDEPFAQLARAATMRRNFADTAFWFPTLEVGPTGVATTNVKFPDSLTAWRIRAEAVTATTQVGDSTGEVVTARKFTARLLMPRFFVEGDVAYVSTLVRNDSGGDRQVAVELILPTEFFASIDFKANQHLNDAKGNLRLRAQAIVPNAAEHRFDWRIRALKAGSTTVSTKAATAHDADAMELTMPILGHGVQRHIARSGVFRTREVGRKVERLTLPPNFASDDATIALSFSTGPTGAILDALPFLAGYPYGCTEQTMSRFYPTVLAVDTLKKLGVDPKRLENKSNDTGKFRDRFRSRIGSITDPAVMTAMAKEGLGRLYDFQHADGGWGWWRDDPSTPRMTSYVLLGLHACQSAGVQVDPARYRRGLIALSIMSKADPKRGNTLGVDMDNRAHAMVAYVLSLEIPVVWKKHFNTGFRAELAKVARKAADELFEQRLQLPLREQALVAISLQRQSQKDKAVEVLRVALADAARELPNRKEGEARRHFSWSNDDVETTAWLLKASLAIEPNHSIIPSLLERLLADRPGGHYWHSTRDTALAVAALTDFALVNRAALSGAKANVAFDSKPVKSFAFDKGDLFNIDAKLVLTGRELKSGTHEIAIDKIGSGDLFYSMSADYFEKADRIESTAAGMSIRRDYFNVGDKAATPLTTESKVKVGDVIEVALSIESDRNLECLAFEDPKPAGCEPTRLQSGYAWTESVWSTIELRDDKTQFFVQWLPKGKHVLRYRLRAETPGVFRVLPTSGFAMYTPAIRANGSSAVLEIQDRAP